MTQSLLLLVPILLPILAGLLLLPLKLDRRPLRRYLLAVLCLNALLTLAVLFQGELQLTVLHLTQRMPIFFRVDGMSRIFCMLASVMFLLVGIYAGDYMDHEQNEGRFYFFYLLVLGMLNGIGLAGNLVTLYLFFEIMTLFSVPLVLHTLTKEAIGAAFKFLFYSLAGASMGLIGLFFIYVYGTTLEFVPGGVLDPAKVAGHEPGVQIAALLAIVGFAAKAGMFPLHAWLPTAHPVAPAPASAVLSGVITKSGVFAVIRYVFYLTGADFLRGSWVQYTWLTLALITVLMGSALAYKEPLLKKRLAYSSVSQVSYVMFGLATLSAGGMLGAMLHTVFHSVIKNALFLVAGAMILRTGKTGVHQLRGIGRQMPVTLWCFTIASVALVGIPPASGFISKWYLATGALDAGIGVFSWLGPVILLVSALLTAGYLLPVTISGFFPGREYEGDAVEYREANTKMLIPMVILAAAALLLGIFPGGLANMVQNVINAVL